MALLLDALFSSVAFGHLVVDILNGQRAILLAYISPALGLSNATLGLISTLYIFSGSLSQPVFGMLADRVGARWLAVGGILAMGSFFSLAILTPGKAAIAWLMLASLSSGAFHPAGAMQATVRGRTHFAGRETTSAAYFFFFGQSGYFLGPLLGGPILDRFGTYGLLMLTGLTLPVGLFAARQMIVPFYRTHNPVLKVPHPSSDSVLPRINKTAILSIIPLMLLAAFQAWSQQNMITFVPKYLHDMGLTPAIYGLIAALFMGGSALGNATGGTLADRFGKRKVAVVALSLATIPLFLVSVVGWSPWLYVIIPLAGAFTGASHSIIVVQAQRLVPGGIGMASGLILGFMFSAGALGTYLSGYLADLSGFPLVFRLTSAIALAAALMAAMMRVDIVPDRVPHASRT